MGKRSLGDRRKTPGCRRRETDWIPKTQKQVGGSTNPFDFPSATSFFVSNLPWEVEKKELREEISKIGVVVDIFIVNNRLDKHGLRFGFIRLNRVQNIQQTVEKLNKVRVGGRNLFAKVSSFERKPKKGDMSATFPDAKKVWGRFEESFPIPKAKMVWSRLGVEDKSTKPGVSFAQAVSGNNIRMGRGRNINDDTTKKKDNIEAMLMFESKKDKGTVDDWKKKVVGQVKNLKALANIWAMVKGEGKCMIDYIGGFWVLISPGSEMASMEMMEDEGFCSCFEVIKFWDGQVEIEDRLTWLSIEGIPLKVWCSETINAIARSWGK